MKLLLKVSRRNVDGTHDVQRYEFRKDCLTIGGSDSDLPISDSEGVTKHIMLYQGIEGELRVIGAKTSYTISFDSILMDDQRVEHGQTLQWGKTAIQILGYEADTHLVEANSGVATVRLPSALFPPVSAASLSFLAERRRIRPKANAPELASSIPLRNVPLPSEAMPSPATTEEGQGAFTPGFPAHIAPLSELPRRLQQLSRRILPKMAPKA